MYSRSAKGGEMGDPNRNPCLAKMCVHMLFSFLSPLLSYFPVFFVVTGRFVDKGSPDR